MTADFQTKCLTDGIFTENYEYAQFYNSKIWKLLPVEKISTSLNFCCILSSDLFFHSLFQLYPLMLQIYEQHFIFKDYYN